MTTEPPPPTFLGKIAFFTPGSLLQGLRDIYQGAIEGGIPTAPGSFSFTLATTAGFRSVVVQFDNGSVNQSWDYVLMTLAEDEKAPARYFLTDPQWSANTRVRFGYDAGAYPVEWAAARDVWTASILAIKNDILYAWSSGSPSDWIQADITNLGGKLGTAAATSLVATDGEILYQGEQLIGFDTGDGFDTPQVFAQPQPSMAPVGQAAAVAGGVLAELRAIREVLRDIATIDVTTSINNGAAAWSAKGRMGAGS